MTGCENEVILIKCAQGQVINIQKANYGRTNTNICRFPSFNTNKCLSDKTVLLQNKCNSLNTCELTVSKNTFGDPCPAYSKYLEVQYSCNGIIQGYYIYF